MVHSRTVQGILNSNVFYSRTPRKKPLISEKNLLEFGQNDINKGFEYYEKKGYYLHLVH